MRGRPVLRAGMCDTWTVVNVCMYISVNVIPLKSGSPRSSGKHICVCVNVLLSWYVEYIDCTCDFCEREEVKLCSMLYA